MADPATFLALNRGLGISFSFENSLFIQLLKKKKKKKKSWESLTFNYLSKTT